MIKKNMRPGLLSTFPWLVADIGGSNARFGLVLSEGSGVQQIRTIPGKAHAHLNEAVHAYLKQAEQELAEQYRAPRMAAFAVATPITDDFIAFTNSPWSFSRSAIQTAFGFDSFLVLNDFEALALSLPKLNATQIQPHQAAPTARGTLAVIGPGTGLGVAGVIETANGWIAIPGEGGHATLAAGNEFESAVLAEVRKHYPHVSAERLLSGIGLPVLHQAVASVMQQCCTQATSVSNLALNAEAILQKGLQHQDPACSKTIDVFCEMLGSFAGNVALTLGARGGVYIGGGIVPRLGERFFSSHFRQRFVEKGRFQAYLENIPTALITDTMAALTGASLAIEQYES